MQHAPLIATGLEQDQRPWGWYHVLAVADHFKVKMLEVLPKSRLSLQRHQHRQEYWVVVQGVAEVTVDEQVQTLTIGQAVHVPVGAVHRLANPGDTLLLVAEIATGVYVGEDDIERLADDYQRVTPAVSDEL
jgi:mannose-6-phosphate isomerase-like protein (cupin superfamily)